MYTSQIVGDGSPLLMLHGWGQSQENLRPLAELLAPISQPHLIDLPGFGKSEAPKSIWSTYDYADEMIRYLDMQKIEKVSLLGHSFGGKVAMCMAVRYPERVQRLILMAPSGLRPKQKLSRKIRLKLITTVGKLLKSYDKISGSKHYTNHFVPRFGSRDYQNAGIMRPILVQSVNEDLSSEVPQIQCPTLILWGEHDTETPSEIGYRLHRLIPEAKLILFPYHDHFLFQDVGSHLCATYIRPFLLEAK